MAESDSLSTNGDNLGRIYIRINSQNAKKTLESARHIKSLRRFVFSASHFHEKGGAVEAAGNFGAEIVLDLNAGETAAPGLAKNFVGKLPWAQADGPWDPAKFREAGPQLLEEMANFSLRRGSTAVDAVLAPTHLLGEAHEWLDLNVEHFALMRAKLDERQAHRVQLDYPVIAPLRRFTDPAWRRRVIDAITGLPISTLWLRVGGDHDAAVASITQIVDFTTDFQSLGRPVVLDMAGDLVALSALAGGGVNALVCRPNKGGGFSPEAWQRETSSGPPPMPTEAYLPGLDTRLTKEEWQDFFFPETVDGNEENRTIHHRVFSCVKSGCCDDESRVFEDVIGHFMRQRAMQIAELETNADRSGRFMVNTYLGYLASRMRALDNLRFSELKLREKIEKFKKKHELLVDRLSTHPGYLQAALPPALPHRGLSPSQRPLCVDNQNLPRARTRPPSRVKSAKPLAPRDMRTPDLF